MSMRKDAKISLVAQRLSMLQVQDSHNSPLKLSPEIAGPHKSSSNMPPRDIYEKVVLPMSSNVRMNDESRKRAQVFSADEFEDCREPINSQTQQTMKKSHKRAKVGNSIEAPTKATELGASFQLCEKRSPAMKQAEDIRSKLTAKYPSFIKLMAKSHVSGPFWLGLPSKFCDDHLPQLETKMVLLDETGKKSYSKYLADKKALSGGWRGFSIKHGLLQGDALVFHLIASDKFKIYIVRVKNTGTVDGTGTLDSCVEHNIEDSTRKVVQVEDTHTLVANLPKCSSVAELGSKVQNHECSPEALWIEEIHTSVDKPPESSSDPELSPTKVLDEIQPSDSAINFDRLKSFENFNITVDGFILDSKFSESIRKKYYELCCTQKSNLHEHLHKGINCNLVVGTISEIVDISDAVSSCDAGGSTSRETLKVWEKTLEGFEFLGMKVGFLQARVKQLMSLVSDHLAEEPSRLKEIIIKRIFGEEKMKALEEKITDLKERAEEIQFEMRVEITEANALEQGTKFRKNSAVVR